MQDHIIICGFGRVGQAKLPMLEIKAIINEFRSRHLSELTELSEASGGSLGYEYSRIMSKPKSQLSDSLDDNQITEGTLVITHHPKIRTDIIILKNRSQRTVQRFT